jgi:DNA processing protein
MELERPRFVARMDLFATRPHRAEGVRFEGLWVSGSLAGLERATVAVVGARAPSEGGRSRAHALAARLASAGVCVISGLAMGIDGAAHAGALAGGGPTLGILGGGHGHFFPRRNRPLATAMLALGGAVLSPFPPDEPARPPQFLQRNGVVVALADALVVVEAAERSGALNTASWAAAAGIDVLAFPGDVDRPKAAGCNALIRDGATLVRGADDVLAALGLASETQLAPARAARPCDPLEAQIVAALESQPCSLDELVEITGAPAGTLLAALVKLELAGELARGDALTYSMPSSLRCGRVPTAGSMPSSLRCGRVPTAGSMPSSLRCGRVRTAGVRRGD